LISNANSRFYQTLSSRIEWSANWVIREPNKTVWQILIKSRTAAQQIFFYHWMAQICAIQIYAIKICAIQICAIQISAIQICAIRFLWTKSWIYRIISGRESINLFRIWSGDADVPLNTNKQNPQTKCNANWTLFSNRELRIVLFQIYWILLTLLNVLFCVIIQCQCFF